jgi:hypothetical protein
VAGYFASRCKAPCSIAPGAMETMKGAAENSRPSAIAGLDRLTARSPSQKAVGAVLSDIMASRPIETTPSPRRDDSIVLFRSGAPES